METYLLLLFLADLLLFGVFARRDRAYIAVPMLIGGATAAFQALQAARQSRQARKLRPSSFIPPALREAEDSARREAMSTRFPGQAEEEAGLRQTVADTFHNVARSSTSPATTLNAASRLSAFEQRARREMGAEARRFRAGATDRLRQIQLRRAGIQAENRRQFEAARSALRGASQQNLFNALSSLGAGAVISHLERDGRPLFTQNPTTGLAEPRASLRLSDMLFNPTPFSLGFSRFNNPR